MTDQPEQKQPQEADHPPDRHHLRTEQRNPRSMQLDRMNISECVQLMSAEDKRVTAAVDDARPAITEFIVAVDQRFNGRNGRLVYFGAGTSGRLGVLDASEMPPTFQLPADRIIGIIAGGDRSLRHSSEGKEDDPAGVHPALDELSLTDNDSVLGIAAGGTTPYVLGGLDYAKQRSDSLTGLLTCTPLARELPSVDHLLFVDTGPEIVTGSTRMKAGTATKLVLNIISTTLMIQAGRTYENLMVDLRATNDKLRDRAARIISSICELERVDAFELLDAADGQVKAAIVMHKRQIPRAAALELLDDCSGQLGRTLEK